MQSTYPKTYVIRATQPTSGLGGREYRIVAVKPEDGAGPFGVMTRLYAGVTVKTTPKGPRIQVDTPDSMTPIQAAALGDCLAGARDLIARALAAIPAAPAMPGAEEAR